MDSWECKLKVNDIVQQQIIPCKPDSEIDVVTQPIAEQPLRGCLQGKLSPESFRSGYCSELSFQTIDRVTNTS